MMASACVNKATMPTESFLDCTPAYTSYGWLSPRISFSRDFSDDRPKIADEKPGVAPPPLSSSEKPDQDASGKDYVDFEFRLHDPVTMLPADELFSDGKLVPLQLATARVAMDPLPEIHSWEPVKLRRRAEASGSDPYVLSPRAPRCSSRWRELLGLKRQQSPKPELQKAASVPSKSSNPRFLKHFLHRNSKSSPIDSSLNLPLLRDSDSESLSISSRLSLSSSSSSGPDHEDLPRLSLDSDKPNQAPILLNRNPPRVWGTRPRSLAAAPEGHVAVVRVGRSPVRRAPDAAAPSPSPRGSSVDSPRMIGSGKILFEGLERSSSSPGSFNGSGPRPRPRGMERSYSANVRVTPVLNVPVCSLRGSAFGFGQLFSPQKKERDGSSAARSGGGGGGGGGNSIGKIKIERASRD